MKDQMPFFFTACADRAQGMVGQVYFAIEMKLDAQKAGSRMDKQQTTANQTTQQPTQHTKTRKLRLPGTR